MKRFDSVAIAFLFLMPALAGCLENEGTSGISADDITVNPGTMIAGEFQPLVITAKRDLSVFIPNLVIDPVSNKIKNYYVSESVGIATGILITALHNAGLVTLTHTPSPMNFLRRILRRGKNERAFIILVTGFPAENAKVPVLEKKDFEDYTSFI